MLPSSRLQHLPKLGCTYARKIRPPACDRHAGTRHPVEAPPRIGISVAAKISQAKTVVHAQKEPALWLQQLPPNRKHFGRMLALLKALKHHLPGQNIGKIRQDILAAIHKKQLFHPGKLPPRPHTGTQSLHQILFTSHCILLHMSSNLACSTNYVQYI